MTDLRISVIDRCNFRCPYCMPEDDYPRDHEFLSKAQRLRFEEIERCWIFAGLGVRKLRLTGGEPLLRRDLPELVRQLAGVPGIDDIAMTTNGSLLPKLALPLREAGLGRMTLSIDALDAAVYRRLSGGTGEVDDVLAAIEAAAGADFGPLKLNCVVMRGVNDDQVERLVEHFTWQRPRSCASSSTWTSAPATPGATTLSCRAPKLRERIARRWPGGAVTEPRQRGRAAQAFADGASRNRFHRLGQRAVLRRLHAVVGGWPPLHLPVRARWTRPARPAAAAGANDAELAALVGRRCGGRATTVAARFAAACGGRRVRASRCTRSATDAREQENARGKARVEPRRCRRPTRHGRRAATKPPRSRSALAVFSSY